MKRILLLTLVAMLAISGLALPTSNTPTHAQDDRLSVVATYSILGDVVANVAGDAADVDVVIPRGGDGHNYAASGSDIAIMEEADVVFSNGVAFEEGLAEILEADSINHQIASMCVPIWDFGAADEHGHGDEEHGDEEGHSEDEDHDHEEGEEHSDEEGHSEDEDHDHEEGEHSEEYEALEAMCDAHFAQIADVAGSTPAYWDNTMGPLYTLGDECGEGHGHDDEEHSEDEDHADEEHGDEEHGDEEHGHEHSCDPHLWMDPYNGMLWTLMVRDVLSELDPANADVYAANADAYLAELAVVAAEVEALYLSIPEDQRVLIANHRVFGYIANPYGFEATYAVIPGGSTASEPSAQDIVELVEVIEDENVPAIFSEDIVSSDVIERIGEETGAQVLRIYTGSLTEVDGPAGTYLDYLRYNATTVSNGLAGE